MGAFDSAVKATTNAVSAFAQKSGQSIKNSMSGTTVSRQTIKPKKNTDFYTDFQASKERKSNPGSAFAPVQKSAGSTGAVGSPFASPIKSSAAPKSTSMLGDESVSESNSTGNAMLRKSPFARSNRTTTPNSTGNAMLRESPFAKSNRSTTERSNPFAARTERENKLGTGFSAERRNKWADKKVTKKPSEFYTDFISAKERKKSENPFSAKRENSTHTNQIRYDDAKLIELTAPGKTSFLRQDITKTPPGLSTVPMLQAKDNQGTWHTLNGAEIERGQELRRQFKEGLRKTFTYYIDPNDGVVKSASKEDEEAVKDYRILWDGTDGANIDVKSINIPSDWADDSKYRNYIQMGEAYIGNELKRGYQTKVNEYYKRHNPDSIGIVSELLLRDVPEYVNINEYMTNDERIKYYYLTGRYGPKAGHKYLNTLKNDVKNRVTTEALKERGEIIGEEMPWLSAIEKPVLAVESAMQGGYNYIQDLTGHEENINPITTSAALAMHGIDEGRNKVVSNGAEKVFLDVLHGVAENSPEIAANVIPYVGKFLSPAIGAAQNMGNKYASYVENDIVGEKGTTLNATISGALGAVSWAFMGKGTGKLVGKLMPGSMGAAKQLTGVMLAKSFSGAGISVSQYTLDRLSDSLFLGENSDFNRMTKVYMAQGMTEDEARDKAWDDTFQGGVSATILGSVTSVVMGLPQDAKNAFSLAPRGKAVVSQQDFDIDTFLNRANEFGIDSESYKNAQRLRNQKSKITDSQIGAQDILLEIDKYNDAVYINAMDNLTGTKTVKGQTDPDANEQIQGRQITISETADEPVKELVRHAQSHRVQDLTELMYSQYIGKLKNSGIVENIRNLFDSAVNEVKALYDRSGRSIDPTLAEAEVASDLARQFMKKTSDVNRVQRMADGDIRITDKAYNAIKDLAARVKALGGRTFRDNLTGLEFTYPELREIEKFYEQAAAIAARRNAAGMGDDSIGVIRYSSKAPESISIKDQLRMHLNELENIEPVSVYEYTSDPVDKKGAIINKMFPNKQSGISINREGYDTIILRRGDVKAGFKYLNTESEFAAVEAIPDVIEKGIEIHNKSDHKNRGYSTVTFGAPVEINGIRGNMAVVLRITNDYRYKVHRVLTLDGKTLEFTEPKNNNSYNAGSTNENAGGSPPITVVDNKGAAPQTLHAVVSERDSPTVPNDSIPQPDSGVKRNSLKRDTTSKINNITYSQQFKRWFGDWEDSLRSKSKVVNDDGTPKVVYHGTPRGGFTRFDTFGGLSKYSMFDNSPYFTESRGIADSYTKTGIGSNPERYEAYLNIRNPIDMDAPADVKKWNKTLTQYKYDTRAEDGKTNGYVYRALEKEIESKRYQLWKDGDSAQYVVERMGYDGITHMSIEQDSGESHRVWIAFNPNQVKSAASNIGTFGLIEPDIRYSLKRDNLIPNGSEENAREGQNPFDEAAKTTPAEETKNDVEGINNEDYIQEQKKYVDNSSQNDIIKSGAVSGALNPKEPRAKKHAKQYYGAVRKMSTDAKNIARNTGFSEEQIQEIKKFIFLDKHDLGTGKFKYFDPSYEMAQSWQRLIDGKNIAKHDLTLIKHEIMEHDLMKQGYSQAEAHIITSRKYNYSAESEEYYGKIGKHKKNK